ncbi:hypothetical protein B0H14DRAFT_3531072 [Mycena olivaceomarginata]|nr:hypothetical protein B0H14DRAFT_3531072 [Mycena olivaceomarginata]
MTQEERTNLEAFLNVPDTLDYADTSYEDDVLRGKRATDISHAGEGIEDPDEDQVDEELLDMLEQQQKKSIFQSKTFSRRPRDRRKHADRTQILVDVFAAQLESMTDAYVSWNLVMVEKSLGAEYTQPRDSVLQEEATETRYEEVPIVDGDAFITSAYVRQGLMPSTPHHASAVITVRTLEVFRIMQLRCPRLGIQVFVRGLCNLHVVAPHPYLDVQFSTAFDAALGHDIPNWRLKNACPTCLYELEGEPKLKRRVIVTQDGNNSLKQFGCRERVVRFDGTVVPGASKERYDHRQAPEDFFLPRSDIEEWAKDEVDELIKGFELEEGEGGDEGAGCEERWENMKEDVTAARVGLSGELAKYGLSVINHLIRVLGEVTVGIDVGCKVARQGEDSPPPLGACRRQQFQSGGWGPSMASGMVACAASATW